MTIRISVRELVEFICRSGDIDNRRSSAGDLSAMREGARIHRLIQNRQGAEYTPEVSLRLVLRFPNYEITIDGRADGIIEREGEPVTIDEIKGVYQDLEAMKEAVPVHLAQARLYAYIYALQNEQRVMRVQMTYCHLETEQLRYFTEELTFEELSDWFQELLGKYRKWADFLYEWRQIRQESAKGLEFPYPYREGQKKLVSGVYRTILREKNLFLQAPTGVGKTITTIFPGVKAMGEEEIDRIFYLTAKTVTAEAPMQTFSLLMEKGLRMKLVRLTAKEKMCVAGSVDCNPKHCPVARGHFDRVNDAVFELLQSRDVFTRETLLKQAEKHQVCPFEMSLDVSSWSDAVVCDYNYVFDPTVALKRFFAEGNGGEHYLFLVDEAHNLVERAREMYSAVLYKEDFLAARRYMKNLSKSVEKGLTKCNTRLLALKRECDDETLLDELSDLIFALMNLTQKVEKFLAKNIDFKEKKDFLEFYFNVKNFIASYDRITENYRIFAEYDADGKFRVRIQCMDPSGDLEERLKKARSTVFFSATMLPIHYYKSLLSTAEDNYAVYADTTFKKEQRLLLIGRDVSSKYTRRGEEEYRRFASYIDETVRAKNGNYIAFFPSYRMMTDIKEEFDRISELSVETIVQSPSMGEKEREEFLGEFGKERDASLVGFCVMGGIFGEGIDLTGERLIGVIIVGTGLPQISREREQLKDFFDERKGDGFDYAYRYPGMNKVQQAAGRVIRTAEDRGVILLLDERFLQPSNLRTFPREWSDYRTVHAGSLRHELEEFWKGGSLTPPEALAAGGMDFSTGEL